jgi:hypothetical protein
LLIALLLSRFARTKKFPGEKHHPVKIHLNVPLKSCKKEFFYFHFARLATIGASCRVRTNLEQGKIMSAAQICFKPLNRKIQQHSDGDKCERERACFTPFPAAAFSSSAPAAYLHMQHGGGGGNTLRTHTPRQHAVSSEKWLD